MDAQLTMDVMKDYWKKMAKQSLLVCNVPSTKEELSKIWGVPNSQSCILGFFEGLEKLIEDGIAEKFLKEGREVFYLKN